MHNLRDRDLGELALDPARYRSSDELRYSLRSIWMYCGWVRNIYVVTAGQRPAWLDDDEYAPFKAIRYESTSNIKEYVVPGLG